MGIKFWVLGRVGVTFKVRQLGMKHSNLGMFSSGWTEIYLL